MKRLGEVAVNRVDEAKGIVHSSALPKNINEIVFFFSLDLLATHWLANGRPIPL
jgi:hypothetical protein